MPLEPGIALAVRSVSWRVATKLVIGAGVVGSVALLALSPRADTSVPKPVRSAAPLVLPEAPRELGAAPEPTHAPTAVDAPAAVRRASVSAPHGQDRLAQEVALLSRATAALRVGHAAQALKALDEHQRKFPSGALREDRRAAKAQALCLLGQVASGRAELKLLPPQSPAAARAGQVCDAGSLTTPAP